MRSFQLINRNHYLPRMICIFATASLVLLFTSILAYASESDQRDPLQYGTLVIAEPVHSAYENRFLTKFLTSHDWGDSHYVIYSASLELERPLTPIFSLGIRGTKYFVSESETFTALREALELQRYSITTLVPNYSVHALATLVPFSGTAAFFGSHPRPVRFIATLGPGITSYQEAGSRFSLTWGLGSTFGISEQVGMQFQFGQERDFGAPETVLRNHVNLGFYVAL